MHSKESKNIFEGNQLINKFNLIINYPRKPNLNNLEKLLNIYETELEEVRASLNARLIKDFKEWQFLIEDSLSILSIKYAMGENSNNLKNTFTSISSDINSAMAICHYLDYGTFIKWLSVTAVANHKKATRLFLDKREEHLEHPYYVNTDYLRVAARVISAFHAGDIETAKAQINIAIDLSGGKNYFLITLVLMVKAVIDEDRSRLLQLIEARAKLFTHTYFQEEKRIVAAALLDFDGLGILARGRHTYGVKILGESVYLPRTLLD